ncbi:unnamed protein product [Merluccius merluccius]
MSALWWWVVGPTVVSSHGAPCLPCGGQQVCKHYVAAESKSFKVPLHYKLNAGDTLTWKLGETIVFSGVSGEMGYRVDQGALVLPPQGLDKVGQKQVYYLEVYDNQGKRRTPWETSVCVLEKVPRPTLEFTCEDEAVVFNCTVPKTQGLLFAWHVDKVLQKSKTNTMSRKRQEDEELEVRCTVSSKAENLESVLVKSNCSREASVWSFISKWPMMYILAGAAGLVLLLLIITIVCCVRARRRKTNRHQVEGELRLAWTNQTAQQDQQQKQQQKKKCQHGGQPQPHRCKPGGHPHRPRPRETPPAGAAGGGGGAGAAGAAHPARPRPSPRPPQQERGCVVTGLDQGPPLPKPRKTNTRRPQ